MRAPAETVPFTGHVVEVLGNVRAVLEERTCRRLLCGAAVLDVARAAAA